MSNKYLHKRLSNPYTTVSRTVFLEMFNNKKSALVMRGYDFSGILETGFVLNADTY